MKRKFIAILLAVCLGIQIGNFISKFTKETDNKTIEMTEVKAEENLVSKEVLDSKLRSEGKLLVAKGEIKMSYLFSNKSEVLKSQVESNNYLSIIKDKLFTREIKFITNFTYNYTYDLSKIKTEEIDGKIKIILSENSLLLEDVSEDLENSKIDESYGWLVSDFSPQEMRAMSKHCRIATENYLNTDRSKREKIMETLKLVIGNMCDSLGIKKYEFKIWTNGTITNLDDYATINQETISTKY